MRPRRAAAVDAGRRIGSLAQTFDLAGVTAETCTARRNCPPTHPFLENSLASIEAAFRLGADVVEIDINPTTDGQFAVFHDWSVDCRGKGTTRARNPIRVEALDIGYGHTADDGATFPFRGRGVGLLPSLDEVLATFPTDGSSSTSKRRSGGRRKACGAAVDCRRSSAAG
ncbi:MAG: glycerophosphodiester phosphodiesterase family protein [Xanthobacteraceae bacterium]